MSENEELLDLESSMAVDDEMQTEIDKLKADPWDLLPNKEGFRPVDLVADAAEGSAEYDKGYREAWSQTEVAIIEDAGMRPLKARDGGPDEGVVAFLQLAARQGPNKGKRIEQSWWLRNGDKEAVRDMNASLQELFGKFKIQAKLVDKGGRKVPSYVGSLDMLKKRVVKFRLFQKWDYPYKQDNQGNWQVQTEEPKKFKKRIFKVEPAS